MYNHSDVNLPLKIKASANDNLNYFLRSGTDQQINFVFHLDGSIDPKIMKKAVRLTMDAEPVLGCKFVKEKRRSYWVRRTDIDELDYFEMIKADNIDSESKKFILTQIDPSIDSLLKIRIFRCENKKDTLVIKSDHSVMDGGGFYDYLSLLCDTYNNLIVSPNYQVTPNLSTNRELNQALKHHSFVKKIKSLIFEKGYSPTWSFPYIGRGKEKKNFILKKIDNENFQQIKDYGKQRGATLNDMFLTASFRALFKLIKPQENKKMTIAVPTDLRLFMPNKKANTITNLVSTTFVSLKYNADDTYDDMLQNISQQMCKKKEIQLGLGLMFMINNLFRFRFITVERFANKIYKRLYKKGKMHPIITNVGIIDSVKRCFGSINVEDAYIITPINWAPSFSMGISSYNKEISLSIGYCEDSYDKRTIELFLELFLTELINQHINNAKNNSPLLKENLINL
ncbi:MAG: hypothetical protein JXA54_02865 [Candidatus Heimdallarchaeota archaeon]|nr:hypothetical protein [Candidatus Heimdallarchaeota archaeon]